MIFVAFVVFVKSRRPFVDIAVACMLVGACTRHSPTPLSAVRPNVLLITVDTLRADRVGRGLTPAIDTLAARGVRFTNARTAVPLTLPSHTSIMTGALPPANGVRINGAAPTARPTIATFFKAAGYRTGAFIGAYVLDRRFGLSAGFDTYDDRVQRDPTGSARLEAERRGDFVANAALAWLDAPDARPFFAWIHLYDPHAPYNPPQEYLTKAGGHPYDGEVAFADAQVGRLLDWLKASGREGKTIVALTGDHGEGLGDHGELTHGMLAYDSTLRVPLVLAIPGRPPAVRETLASLTQIAGTLLSLAGISVPDSMDRAFLIQPPGDGTAASVQPGDVYAETQYPATAGWHPLAVLADARWKLIASSENELYDVSTDPGERRNIAAEKAALAEAMRTRALSLATHGGTVPDATPVPSDAAERLRALGYVSGTPSASTDRAPNPARHIAAWNTFEGELTRLSDGEARAALPGLARLARAFPDAPAFQATYARALKDVGLSSQAVEICRRLVARWPQDAAMYHDLAVAAAAAGQPAEAARAERASLALQPSNAAASNGLGLLLVASAKPGEAIAAFERAVKDDPSNAVFRTNLGNARRDANDAAGAEQAYRSAIDLDPRSADAANGLGVLLVQAHRAADAIPWFERALAGSPQFSEARLNLGIAYQESGNREQAIDMYRRVLASAPPGSREYRAAASLLAQLGRQ